MNNLNQMKRENFFRTPFFSSLLNSVKDEATNNIYSTEVEIFIKKKEREREKS